MVCRRDENWTSRGVYPTICRLFKIKSPFYENRLLSHDDFKAVEAEFVSRAIPRVLNGRQRLALVAPTPSKSQLRAHILFEKLSDQCVVLESEYLSAPPKQQARMRQDRDRWVWAGRLLFADSAKGQQRARTQLRERL